MNKMLRVGKITYANCTPIFDGLERMNLPYVEIVPGVPSALNDALARGDIDLCISSSIEFPRHADDYLIMPDFCIASDGAVQSVLFFSMLPLKQLHGREVLVTSESATSVILLQILLERYWLVRDVTVTRTTLSVAQALKASPAVLVIGDTALQAHLDPPSQVTCYDLGEIWKCYTGLPFVYALWLVHRKAVQDKARELALFREALVTVHRDMIVKSAEIAQRAVERTWIPLDRLKAYWTEAIQYHLTTRHLQGVEAFYREACLSNAIFEVPHLQFVD